MIQLVTHVVSFSQASNHLSQNSWQSGKLPKALGKFLSKCATFGEHLSSRQEESIVGKKEELIVENLLSHSVHKDHDNVARELHVNVFSLAYQQQHACESQANL